ncbi:MAG: LPXTG cell wall anchor domain-containing protein [Anaerolineaceae bacterium]
MSDQIDENLMEPFDEENPQPEPEPEPNKPGNRAFITIIGIIGAITLVAAAVGIGLLYMQNTSKLDEAAQINAENTMTVQAATQQAYESGLLLTPSATLIPVETEAPSPTPVIVFPTDTPEPTATVEPVTAADLGDPRTATVAALLTQAAQGNPTAAAAGTLTAQPTALPTTGFADEVGLPGLFGLALLGIVILFVARRLRTSTR